MPWPLTRLRTVCGVDELAKINTSATDDAARLGRTLFLVPHPDDETIGCGGLLCLLARAQAPVQVLLLSDGTGSHPHSRAYPAERLRALRGHEMRQALAELGHPPSCLQALGLPDGALPSRSDRHFDTVLHGVIQTLAGFGPDTVVMPVPDDGHPDHRATHALGAAACAAAAPRALQLGYTVWGGGAGAHPRWHIDIADVLPHKRRALARHRSQHGQVIADDPAGFVLPQELLARCSLPHETYFELSRAAPA